MKTLTITNIRHRFFAFTIAFLCVALMTPSAFAYGPERDTYTWQDVNSEYFAGNWPKDKIVFNSIVNTPNFGDERNFVAAREYNGDDNGFKNEWYGTSIDVKDGQEYKIRLYVDNNSPHGYEGIAANVRTFFSIPSVSAKQIKVSGFITADNADEVWDSVTFKSDQPFHLEYQYGSAILENSGIGKVTAEHALGLPIGDDVVTDVDGALIGYDALDGKIPGGYEHVCYITIRVKAVFDHNLIVDSNIRRSNYIDKTWKNATEASIGDKVDIIVQYKNTSNIVQKNVAIKVILPDGLRFVSGSGQLTNSSHPDGALLEGEYIVSNGIAIGNYEPNAAAQITFTAEVTDAAQSELDGILTSVIQIGVESSNAQGGVFVMQDSVETVIREKTIMPYVIMGLIMIAICCLILIGYLMLQKRYCYFKHRKD